MSFNKASDDFTVFISYAHEDNEGPDPSRHWLNRLLQHLQPLVFQKQVRTWSDIAIEIGDRWHESIKAQIPNARVAVLLVSPAFLASEYIRNNELPMLLMNAQYKGVTVLPIILRRCLFAATKFKYPDPVHGPQELPLSIFQSANSPDKPLNAMQEHEQDEVFVSIAERILTIAQQNRIAPLPDVITPSVWDIPHLRNPFFTGRAKILDHLHRELIATGKATLSLSGMGGVGKTQTVIEYAYRHRGEYRAVFWVKADSKDSLNADLAAIAVRLDLPEKDENDRDKVVSATKLWLEEHSGWLLILDNADDLSVISELLQCEWGGHILVTTRAYVGEGASQIQIMEMPPEEGSLLLLRRARLIAVDEELGAATESDRHLAADITREIGGLPLALDQIGAFVEEMPSSLNEYIELYRTAGTQLRAARGGLFSDHASVSVTFSLAFRQVESISAGAADILRVCAFLAPDAIPEEIFINGAKELGENLALVEGGGINLVKMIGLACRFSLVRRNTNSRTIGIHRLVQLVVKDEMNSETRQLWAERVIQGLNKAFPYVEFKNWAVCERLLPHAQEAARLIADYGFKFTEAARLLNQAGYYCNQRAQYAEAESLLTLALNIREKALGPNHPELARSINNLAYLYTEQGRNAEVESMYIRALNIYEKSLGVDHPEVATSLNNLASLYKKQGKYTDAEPLLERSLSIREKAFGPDHQHVAQILNNLAHLYNEQGRYEEATSTYMRALKTYEKALGPDHPEVATSLHNLAYMYSHQGKLTEAAQLYERALSIRETTLGPDHPKTALTRENYTKLLQKVQDTIGESV